MITTLLMLVSCVLADAQAPAKPDYTTIPEAPSLLLNIQKGTMLKNALEVSLALKSGDETEEKYATPFTELGEIHFAYVGDREDFSLQVNHFMKLEALLGGKVREIRRDNLAENFEYCIETGPFAGNYILNSPMDFGENYSPRYLNQTDIQSATWYARTMKWVGRQVVACRPKTNQP